MEDFLYRFLSLYYYFPPPIKRFIGSLYNMLPIRLRYGSFYSEYMHRIKAFNSLSTRHDVLKKQEEMLIENVNRAIETVPYYSDYEKLDSIDTFRSYPVIDKRTIQDSYTDFIHPTLRRKSLKSNTGGSSGTPMEFLLEKGTSRPKEKAHFDSYWGQFGYKPSDKVLMVRGLPLAYNRNFEYDTISNLLNVSCYNINDNNIEGILEIINKFNPSYIHAYPSSLKVITSLLYKYRPLLKFSIKAIFLGSEHLLKNDREYFEKFYRSRVASWYGHTERLIHGGNCPYSNEFHFYPYYGFVELLDDDNIPIVEPGKQGHIVATGFDNQVNPFIRYNTGDLGVLSGKTTCKCGFKGVSLKEISGRGQDFIVLKNNTRVSVTAFIFGQHLEAFPRIREMQMVQEKMGHLEIRIVRGDDYKNTDEASIISTLEKSVSGNIEISITYVKGLPKTFRGKNIFFVSKINS